MSEQETHGFAEEEVIKQHDTKRKSRLAVLKDDSVCETAMLMVSGG